MTTLRPVHWFAACLLAALAFPVHAAEERAHSSQPHVVLIGISQYADKQIQPRPNAENDVKALYDLFTSKDYLGVSKENIRLLLGKEDSERKSIPATKENILAAVHAVVKEAKRDDLVIFAFFGQGASVGERGDRTCYFASDSTLKDRAKNAIAAADLGQEFDKLKSEKVCFFVDVNFKGFDPGKESIPEASLGTSPYKEFLGDDRSEDHSPMRGRVIFLATNGLNPSVDLKDHGLFTTALLEGLKGDADTEGYEPDGLITVDEMSKFLGKRVQALLGQHVKSPEEQRKKDHFIIGGQNSHFALTTNPKAIAKSRERLEKFVKLAKDQALSKELSEEGTRLLERMPRLQVQRDLRKEYQGLVDGSISLDAFKDHRTALLAKTRLPASDSIKFANTVIRATNLVDRYYVKEVNQGELVANAIRGLYRRIDEKLPEEIAEKLGEAKKMRQQDLAVLLQTARNQLGKREDLDNHKDIDHALQRMLGRLDPYTTYIDPETVKRFETEYRGEFTGIGVQIRKDLATDMLQVVTPIKGSPSYRKGLMAGDLIMTLTRPVDSDGNPLNPPEVLQTKDLALNEAVKKILGQAGTKITLTVKREGVPKPFDVEITRSRIELESVFGVKRKGNDSWDYMIDPVNKIGYVRLSSFAKNTASDLTEVVRQLKRDGMKALILDLRFNPGGLLTSATEISDLFIKDEEIVSVRPRVGAPDVYRGKEEGSQLDFPMVCMVNGFSASASEIVSACLQDHKRAVIVGERSYGKGSVQNIADFADGKIKLTIASFWRPSGKNLNKSSTSGKDDEEWGVTPDKGFLVELTRKEREDLAEHQRNTEIIPRRDMPTKEKPTEFKDRQLEVALKYLRDLRGDARQK